jgi:hypothetical protein
VPIECRRLYERRAQGLVIRADLAPARQEPFRGKASLTQQGGCPIELAQKIGRQGENRRSIFGR